MTSDFKLITGKKGKGALTQDEPITEVAEPSPPDFLSDDAKMEWSARCHGLFVAGIMTELDQAALAAYCQSYGRWVQAEREIELMGGALTIQAGNGTTIPNPLLHIANTAMKDVVKYAAEFGMTPITRSKIVAVPVDSKTDIYAEFFTR